MASDLKDTFDTYNRRARLYPGFLTASPIAVFVVLLWKNSPIQAVGPVLIAVGGLFFLANLVRTLGKRLEARLIRQWNGLPTTHLLRYSETKNTVQLERWHAKLERVTGVSMPSKSEEATDPATADDTYVTATRALIPRVRDSASDFPRVQEENIHYGFRRNLLALKPVGLAIVVASMLVDIVTVIWRPITVEILVAGAIHAVILAIWLLVINETWVLEAGEIYAERLFEGLEKLDIASPSGNG